MPPPYGTVEVSVPEGGGAATIIVTGAQPCRFGDGGMFGFNVVGSAAGLTVNGPPSLEAVYYSRQVSGFGVFEAVIKNHGGFASAVPTFTLTVNRPVGFASAYDLVEFSTGPAGYGNAFFVAHVFNADGSITGYAGAVPETSTLVLLGSGLAALGGWMRWRRNRTKSGRPRGGATAV